MMSIPPIMYLLRILHHVWHLTIVSLVKTQKTSSLRIAGLKNHHQLVLQLHKSRVHVGKLVSLTFSQNASFFLTYNPGVWGDLARMGSTLGASWDHSPSSPREKK